jgi:hypothetical protein
MRSFSATTNVSKNSKLLGFRFPLWSTDPSKGTVLAIGGLARATQYVSKMWPLHQEYFSPKDGPGSIPRTDVEDR